MFSAFTASVCDLRPESREYVRIKNADSAAAPEIAPNYLATDVDRKVYAGSLRLNQKIVAAPALKKYSPEEFKPGMLFQFDEELAEAAGDIGTTIFHPVGTCKMGDDSDSVVDASIMPPSLWRYQRTHDHDYRKG